MQNKIQKLDDKTISKIAAGEVVERPAQVVKELIENSIDAGSSSINIEIENGGFDSIIITDNGSGIDENDLLLSIERHATSKLSKIEDLHEIYSLGFRGEALSSIASISKLQISSKKENSDGCQLSVLGGEVGKIVPCAMNNGTIVKISDIFFNVPARLAFQRRPATESAKIVEITVEHAMAHPNISFNLKNEGRLMLNVPAVENLQDRLFDLLGLSATKLIRLQSPPDDENAPGDEVWSGWISPPELTRGRNDDVHILVNNRVVTSQPFSEAIRRGYHTRLMVGRHPVAVLNLNLPANELDVNVHPTKREIRLKHSWRVLQRLERSIQYTLSMIPTQPENKSKLTGISINNEKYNEKLPTYNKPAWVESAGKQLSLNDEIVEEHAEIKEEKIQISTSPSIQQTLPELDRKPIAPALSIEERDLHRYSGRIKTISPIEEPELELIQKNNLPEMEPLCQFANTYIVVQTGKELLLVDQHALHERIRFERLRYSKQSWAPQSRLEPLILNLTPIESERLRSQKGRIEELGFKIDEFNEKWRLLAQPEALPSEKIIDFISDIIQDLGDDQRRLDSVDKLKDHVAFMQSCRGAVKANQILSLAEMRRLLSDMRNIPNPWACVHGRPTALKISIDELDKHFGRHG
ncbi:MAG: DNA mismatch repair endonuclease MutL [Candidatus Thermoplasmatota archaeon]|nr:DNA mismatch repair endonuclease MutL [Candidatus Thermoplasmatota archaeon]